MFDQTTIQLRNLVELSNKRRSEIGKDKIDTKTVISVIKLSADLFRTDPITLLDFLSKNKCGKDF